VIVPTGNAISTPLKRPLATIPAAAGWQTIEIVCVDNSIVYLANGKFAAALTDLLDIRTSPATAIAPTPIEFWAVDSRPVLFRNIEVREINALPPEFTINVP
jgi:hypothetical protein